MSHRRRLSAVLSIIMAVTLVDLAGVTPAAAAGPSTELEQTASVGVTAVSMTGRAIDDASAAALSGNQSAGGSSKQGAGISSASPLTPSATWQVSPHTGDFGWSYPLRVPPVPGSLTPSLGLSYSSSSVDSRTSATNNQASWIGDGWDLSVGFIERAYEPCKQTGDLCWRNDNATAAFSGGGRLIHESGDLWRSESDDGSRIERFYNAGNGDDNGEYWKITKVDGTQYFFGSRPEAASTWKVPVRGDNAGDACEGVRCVQAWRWNLDKVVDTHGNVILYGYEVETNKYGDPAVAYDRAGYLRTAEYGPLVDGKRSAKVDFALASRCVPGSDCLPSSRNNWPDVDWNSACDAASCPDKRWPSFWSTKRLSSVTTSVLKSGVHQPVDSWTLEHSFPYAGDEPIRASLWLRSIVHSGHVGPAGTHLRMPAVLFEGVRKPNRVSLPQNFAPLNRYRVSAIVSETGGVIDVKYRDPECTAANLPSSPEHNTMLCYPVKWREPGMVGEHTDYFHKYVVSSVEMLDRFGSGVTGRTRYEYHDGAAWHYTTSEFTEDADRTWNEYRGFGRVRVLQGGDGDSSGPVTMSEYKYHRGMDGDTLPGGATRSVTVDGRPDHNWLTGFNYHTATHLGVSDTVVAKTLSVPSWQGPSATRGAIKSYLLRTGSVSQLTALAAGGWRETKTETSFDDRGLAVTVNDLGDVAKADDDRKTTTTYARNVAAWILSRPAQVETKSGETLLSSARTSYDGQAHGVAPSKGDVTRVDVASAPGVYQMQSRIEYDGYGRPLKTYDPLERTTTTTYSPEHGPLLRMTTANALQHTVAMEYEPAWGVVTKTVNENGKVTETAYDALGRATEVWMPNRSRSSGHTGNARFSYLVRTDGPSVVSLSRLGPNGNYLTSKTLYDGLLRVRQVQSPAAGGGRLITDTRYDTFGRVKRTTAPYFNSAALDDRIWEAHDAESPAITSNFYDGAGRIVQSQLAVNGVVTQTTTTAYGGDRVTVTPPPGAPTVTTVTDGRGQTIERVQAGQSTKYGYTKAGQLATITDPAGNTWRYHYDLLGRRYKTEDVDKGTSTSVFDAAGQQVSTTDARGVTLTYAYDQIGRPTSVRRDATTLAEWAYDPDPVLVPNSVGKLAKATRYHGGFPYSTEILGYSALGQITSAQVVIPEAEQTLGGRAYVTGYKYNVDGSLREETLPALGDLPQEMIVHKYDDAGRPLRTYGGWSGSTIEYVLNSEYTRYGELSRAHLGEGAKRAWITSYRQVGTRRLDRVVVDAEAPAPLQSDTTYGYDPAGNVTSITNAVPAEGTDRQCFRYDDQQRLTDAWTPTGSCATAPASSTLDGPAPYWQSYSYDLAGNRIADRERTYAYGSGHRLTSVTKGSEVDTYAYDAAGNTVDRDGHTVEWDALGHMTRAGGTAMAYDAAGSRLIRKDADSSTLYLPNQELRLDKNTGQLRATRYYTHGGRTIAVRTGGKLSWIAGDHQNTATVAIDADTLSVTRRRFDPFGNPRGDQSGFPGEQGFVGGTKDQTTGLTHLGAREYDPALGRFISVDPILVATDPQQLNSYGYANNSPVTLSDPSGLIRTNCPDGECRGGGWDPGKGPASTQGKWEKPEWWDGKPAQAPDGECRFCGRGYGKGQATTFRRGIPPNEPYIPGLCPDGVCSEATKFDYEKNRRARAYDSYQADYAAEFAATKAAVAEREACGFWCGVGQGLSSAWDGVKSAASTAWKVATEVTDSGWFKWIGVGLSVIGLFVCPVCAAIGFAMSFVATAVSCGNGKAGDCALGLASLALGGLGKGIGDLGKSAVHVGRTMMGTVGRNTPLYNQAASAVASGTRTANAGFVLEAGGTLIDADGAAAGQAGEAFKSWIGR